MGFARVVPMQPNGKEIDYSRTKCAENLSEGEGEAVCERNGAAGDCANGVSDTKWMNGWSDTVSRVGWFSEGQRRRRNVWITSDWFRYSLADAE